MEWRSEAEKAEREERQYDPHKCWTIETPVRALKERQQAKDKNEIVKNVLDQQVAHAATVRQTGKQTDIQAGQEQISRALEQQLTEK